MLIEKIEDIINRVKLVDRIIIHKDKEILIDKKGFLLKPEIIEYLDEKVKDFNIFCYKNESVLVIEI